MQEDEQPLVVGAAMYRQAGCLLAPFIPVRATGALTVTTRRIVFDPVFQFKLLTRSFEIDVAQISRTEVTGSRFGFSFTDFIRIGKDLTIRLKNGQAYTFRSVHADPLAEAIDEAVRRRGPTD